MEEMSLKVCSRQEKNELGKIWTGRISLEKLVLSVFLKFDESRPPRIEAFIILFPSG